MRINVKPRDIKPGDKIDQLDYDTMGVSVVAVTSVEKVRVNNNIAYRVHLAQGKPFVVSPGVLTTVEREEDSEK